VRLQSTMSDAGIGALSWAAIVLAARSGDPNPWSATVAEARMGRHTPFAATVKVLRSDPLQHGG